ncbi:MAG TPA: hypothetical protein VGQ99_07620 [Tepidisphaeraceae bacterium]|jgi:hypothetical protein|nr:hypothetical protein [Tepidisphaeraceae bacterium]
MNRPAGLLLLSMIVAAAIAPPAKAQGLISINSLSSPLTENFDGIGSASGAILPLGWRVGPGGAFEAANNATEHSAGTSGTGVLLVNSPGGNYNFANGENPTSTDRCIGFLSSQFSVSNKSLFMGLQNNTGSNIGELYLSYDVEKYRSGYTAYDMKLFYGPDGTSWTLLPEATVHYNADSSLTVVNPPTSISQSVVVSGLDIPNEGMIYFRWFYTAVQNQNAQALGIDNIQLIAAAAQQPDLKWDGAPGSAWDTVASNWKNSSGGHVAWNDNIPGNASFVDAGAAVATAISLASPRRAGRLTFDAAAASYSLSGSSLSILGAGGTGIIARSDATIQCELLINTSQTWEIDSNLTISGQLTLGSNTTITKKGLGTVELSGPQNIAPNSQLQVSAGTLRLAANVGNAAEANLHLKIQGNPDGADATVILTSDQDLANLTISTSDTGHQGLDLSSPLTPGAFRSLRIHPSDLASMKSSLHDFIRQARLTPGDGIYDSGLASHPNSSLGLATTANGYILLRPTRIGDLNLDGQVTISDFIDLSSNFNRTGVTWQEGDLNFDGSVTISDFIDLASNFGTAYNGQAFPISPADQQALDDFASTHGIPIPEPASFLIFMPALVLLRRRRLQSPK